MLEHIPLSLLSATIASLVVGIFVLFVSLRAVFRLIYNINNKSEQNNSQIHSITFLLALLIASFFNPSVVYFIITAWVQLLWFSYYLLNQTLDCIYTETMIAAGCENGGVILGEAWKATFGSIDKIMPVGVRLFELSFIKELISFIFILVILSVLMRWWVATNKSEDRTAASFIPKAGTFSNIFFGIIFLVGFYFTFSALLSHSLLRNNSDADDQIVSGVVEPIVHLAKQSFETENLLTLKDAIQIDANAIVGNIRKLLIDALNPGSSSISAGDRSSVSDRFVRYTDADYRKFITSQNNTRLLEDTFQKLVAFNLLIQNKNSINRTALSQYSNLIQTHIIAEIEFVKKTKTGRAEKISYLSDVRRWLQHNQIKQIVARLECGPQRTPSVETIERSLTNTMKASLNRSLDRAFPYENKSSIEGINFDIKDGEIESKVSNGANPIAQVDLSEQFSQFFKLIDATLSYRMDEIKQDYIVENSAPPCNILQHVQDIGFPIHPVRGSNLGPLAPFVMWLLSSEAKEPVIIIGLLGVSLVGASLGRVYRKYMQGTLIKVNDDKSPILNREISLSFSDSFIVICYGVAASIIMFLVSYGGLSVLQEGAVQGDPDTYILFAVCLVSAMYSEDVWAAARRWFDPDELANNKAAKPNDPLPQASPPTAPTSS